MYKRYESVVHNIQLYYTGTCSKTSVFNLEYYDGYIAQFGW